MASFKKILPFLKARYAPRGARQSFSESGEDIVMSNILRKLGVKNVSYLDIGAHQPVFGNNTYLFYKNGGRGVLVEPNKELCEAIKKKRPRDVCVNAGAAASDGQSDFFIFTQSTRSTFSKAQAEAWERTSGQKPMIEKRSLLSLDTIFKTYCAEPTPDIISIDAEGLDAEILAGFSWKRRPKVFCIENQDESITGLMKAHGYSVAANIFQNTVFVDTTL